MRRTETSVFICVHLWFQLKRLIVTRGGRGNVMVMSEAEFTGWKETVHLLSSPRNAARLMESVRQARAGQSREKVLVAPRKHAD